MLVAAGLVASYVCGASFSALPPGWHQSGSGRALIIDGVVPSNTFSWAATPRTVYDLTRPLRRDGIYVSVILKRPEHGPSGTAIRLPLRLRDARLIEAKLPPGGALIFVIDYGELGGISGIRASDFPRRPTRFRLGGFAIYECFGPSYMIRFRESGRFFQVHVVLGRRAGRDTCAKVLRVLDSFRARRI